MIYPSLLLYVSIYYKYTLRILLVYLIYIRYNDFLFFIFAIHIVNLFYFHAQTFSFYFSPFCLFPTPFCTYCRVIICIFNISSCLREKKILFYAFSSYSLSGRFFSYEVRIMKWNASTRIFHKFLTHIIEFVARDLWLNRFESDVTVISSSGSSIFELITRFC